MKYLLLMMLLVTGCSFTENEQVTFKATCDQLSAKKHLAWNVQAHPNDLLFVTLCSNPTTGFQWSKPAQISDESVVEQKNHIFISSAKPMPGSASREEWTLSTLKKGTTTVVWEYSRPWDGGEKGVWSLTATIVID